MKADAFLRDVVEALDMASIPYMLIGSFASTFWTVSETRYPPTPRSGCPHQVAGQNS